MMTQDGKRHVVGYIREDATGREVRVFVGVQPGKYDVAGCHAVYFNRMQAHECGLLLMRAGVICSLWEWVGMAAPSTLGGWLPVGEMAKRCKQSVNDGEVMK